jgi:hypothetical protein
MVCYTGQRIHSRLNVAASDIAEQPRCFWVNSDWLQEDTTAHPLGILLESNPLAIRPTGRIRLEKRQRIVGREEIECAEMEVLVPEDGLLRQCYYCLEWEQDNIPRFGKCGWGDDVYWCSSVGSFASFVQTFCLTVFLSVKSKDSSFHPHGEG